MKKHYVFLRRFSEQPVWGGCENRVLDYFARIDYSKTTVTLLVNHDLFSQRFNERKISARVQLFPFNLRTRMRHFWKMLIFLRSFRPTHVVIIQGAFTDFTLADFLAGYLVSRGRLYSLEVLGAPKPPLKISRNYFGFLHGIGLWWYSQMIRMNTRSLLCTRILAVSEEVKQRLVSFYRYPAERITTVFHGVDTDRFRNDPKVKREMRDRLGFSKDDILFISTARLSTEKRIDRLIRAFDAIYSEHKNIRLLLLGTGSLEAELKTLAGSLPCVDRIAFLGFQEDVSDYLKMSDVYVLPSDIEGLGIALLEAMATGLICVATHNPGPNEILQGPHRGFLVEKTDEGIRQGMINALRLSPDEKLRLAEQARLFISEHFQRDQRVSDALRILGIDTVSDAC